LLGADFMRAKREQARERRGGVAARPTTDARPTEPPPGHSTADESAGSTPDGATRPFDAQLTLALRGLGFAAAEVRRAMAATAEVPAATLETRLRAALAVLTPVHPFRCSEGSFDVLALTLAVALAGPPLGRTTMC